METKNNISQLLEYDLTLFNLTNPTNSSVNVNLFNVNGAEIPNVANNELGEPQFYINGDTDYNSFVRDTFTNPKNIQRIKMFIQNDDDLNNNIEFGTRNADGTFCGSYICPGESISSSQKQGKVILVEVGGFLLNQSTIVNYTIPANKSIKWLLYYQEFKITNMLSNPYNYNENLELVQSAKRQTYTLEELKSTELKNKWVDFMETTNR